MRILKAGVLYFILVFGVGFALGTVRVLLIVPRAGERNAELMETPFMMAASFLAARWVGRRVEAPGRPARLLAIGFLALSLLLVAELGMVRWVRGLTFSEYVATRDPVSGAVYLAALAIFAVMPLLAGRR